MMRASYILLAAALVALTFLVTLDTPLAQAQATVTPGSFDTSFSSDGRATTSFSSGADSGQAVAIQSDGKLVVAGYSNESNFAVARYNTDGTLDTSFGNDGKATTSIGSNASKGLDVQVQPDGKIVVAGHSNNGTNEDFALVRYNADGTLDTSFGEIASGQTRSGKLTTALGTKDDAIEGIVLQPDGKILVAGWSHDGSSNEHANDVAIVRYTSKGDLDTTFDEDGKVVIDFSVGNTNKNELLLDIDLLPDSKIVAAGSVNGDFLAMRFNNNGNLDTTFGTGGKTITDIGGYDVANSVAVQSDGKVILAGRGQQKFILVRYTVDGTLDDSFGSDGIVTTDLSVGDDFVNDVVVQPDGRIIATGHVGNDNVTPPSFGLVRYNANGSLDTTFRGDGYFTHQFANRGSSADSIALQPDGKIVVSGSFGEGHNNDFALARYNNAPVPVDVPDSALFVSNHGQTKGGSLGSNGAVNAQGFTTGSSPSGYVVTSIEAVMEAGTGAYRDRIWAEIWTVAANGKPGEKVASLAVPHTSGGAVASFVPQDNPSQGTTTLDSETDYFFLLYTTNNFNIKIDHVTTTDDDAGPAEGWSIADSRYWKNSQTPGTSAPWTEVTDNKIIRIAIKGYALVNPPEQLKELLIFPGSTTAEVKWALPMGTVSTYDIHYTSALEGSVDNNEPTLGSDSTTSWVDSNYATHSDGVEYNIWVVEGLTTDTTYRFRARARNALGAGLWAFGKGTPAALKVPSGLTVTPGNGRLRLNWEEQSGVLAYKVEYTSDPSTGWTLAGNPTNPRYTITGPRNPLDNGTTYRVRVRAERGNEEGPWGFVEGTPDELLEPPDAEVSISVSPDEVPEGSPVTVTVTLSNVLDADVDIPITYCCGTAEPTDHSRLTSITVPSGETAVEAQISTAQDEDGDDETFSVVIGVLPDTLAVGASSWVEVTIRDSDREVSSDDTLTLTTNADEPIADNAALTASDTVAQAFETGSNTNGYTLNNVEVQFAHDVGQPARDSMKAQIWSDNGAPDTKLYDLTVPSAITAGAVSFLAPESTALSADTTYWFVIWADPISNSLKTTVNDAQTGETGWTIEDTFHKTSDNPPTDSSTWDAPSDGRSLLMTIMGKETPLWSAALTVQQITADTAGCDRTQTIPTVRCSTPATLTDDDFSYGGAEYEVYGIIHNSADNSFTFTTGNRDPNGLRALTLRVGDRYLPIADATISGTSNSATWSGVALNWSPGDVVLLALVERCNCTVSLSASPLRVDEGESVTITATLSSASTNDETIPLAIINSTAEPDDYSMLESITVNAGETAGTGVITTTHDAGIDDEKFAVKLRTLPQGITEGSQSSVDITIKDNDFRLEPSSFTVTEGDSVRVQVLNFTSSTAVESTGKAKVGTHLNHEQPGYVADADFFMEPSTTYQECTAGSPCRYYNWGHPYDGWLTIRTVVDDKHAEGNEAIVLTGFDALDTTQRTEPITITVREFPRANLILTPTSTVLRKGGDPVTVALSLDRPSPETTAIRITPSGTAEILPLGAESYHGHDYQMIPTQMSGPQPEAYIWIERGERRATRSLTLTALNDATTGETITLTASSGGYPHRFKDGTTTITIGSPQPGSGDSGSQGDDGEQRQQSNQAPLVAQPIGDATIVNESATHTALLSEVFIDADNDPLNISAASSNAGTATVSVATDRSTLTVSAKSRGTATVTVTADDGNGGTVADSFAVTVKAAPTVSAAIADVTGLEAGSTQDVSLLGVFGDADGDALSITAVSSNPARATVSVASGGSKLALAGVAEGTATITVAAQDSDGNRVSDAFQVSVVAPPPATPNEAPTVSSGIADIAIVNESGTKQVSLTGVFSDSDNDALSITAASSDEAKATVSVAADHSSLTVTAQARGTATITVTANDGRGGTVSDAFTATVKAAPVVTSAISDLNLEVADTQEVSLSTVFSDADGDALTYSADTSDSAVANAFPFQGTLTIVGLADGSATITVTAQDADGNAVSDTFDVKVVGPPTPVSNLSCVAQTDWVLFQWDAPEWSGAELYAYDYGLTRPDGRSEQVRLRGYPLVRAKGDYQVGQDASISIKAVYELADESVVYSEAVELTCTVAE